MSIRSYRPSGVLKYEDCPRAFYYQYVEKIRSSSTSSNLIFGTAVHAAVTGYLDGSVTTPEDKFRDEWRAGIDSAEVEYTSRMGPEDLEATGVALTSMFPEAWEAENLMVLRDTQGPVIERRFSVEIDTGVYLNGQPDIVAMDDEARIHVIDIKTPASVLSTEWHSDQVTAYQYIVEAHKESLGIEEVSGVGFHNLLKRKMPNGKSKSKGPEIHPIEKIPARTLEQLDDYAQKIRWMDEDVVKGRFSRRGRMAHNTPCGMCDFAGLCLNGSWEGLQQPQQQQVASLV